MNGSSDEEYGEEEHLQNSERKESYNSDEILGELKKDLSFEDNIKKY